MVGRFKDLLISASSVSGLRDCELEHWRQLFRLVPEHLGV